MIGSSPGWSAQAPRCSSRGCSRSQAWAWARAVAAGVGRGRDLRCRPGRRGGPGRTRPVPRRAAASARAPGRCRTAQHPVGAQPAQQLHRQVGEQVRQPVHVVAGVEHDQDVRVTVVVLPGRAQPPDQVAQLARRSPRSASWSGPSRTASSSAVHDVRPGSSAATNEYGHPGIRWDWPCAAAVDVAEQPIRRWSGRPSAATG